jgi:hypothetical protein
MTKMSSLIKLRIIDCRLATVNTASGGDLGELQNYIEYFVYRT